MPNTRKGPHGTPHGTLRPLVSGTQRLPQSNRVELETAVHREAGYPGLIWGTNPFHSTRAPATLPAESPDTRKGPHRIPHVILRPLVSGTQLLPGVWFEHQISGYLPCKKRACSSGDSVSLYKQTWRVALSLVSVGRVFSAGKLSSCTEGAQISCSTGLLAEVVFHLPEVLRSCGGSCEDLGGVQKLHRQGTSVLE